MQWTSIVAIFTLFWVLSAFLVLPFGISTHEEAGIDKIPGQADSAPAEFRPARIAIRATILAAILFGAFYANYINGWVGAETLDFFRKPAELPNE